jgi:hypothetical protein
MLTEARLGQLSGKSIRGFACLARPIKYEDGINATELVRIWVLKSGCSFASDDEILLSFPLRDSRIWQTNHSSNGSAAKLACLSGQSESGVKRRVIG